MDGHKNPDLVLKATLVPACCFLADQGIRHIIAKSIVKVTKFLKFTVSAQALSKNKLSENLY